MSINRYAINVVAINAIAAAASIGHAAVFGASGDFTASGTRSNARQGSAQIAASGGFTASGKKVASNSKTVTGSGSGAINSSSVNSRAINAGSPGGSTVVPIPFVFSASGGFTASGKKGINATAKFYDSAYSIAAGEKTAFSNRSIASTVGGSGAINGKAINTSAINGAAGSVTTFTPVPIPFAASGGFVASGGSSANPGHSAVFAGSGDFQAAGKQPKEFANFWASGGFAASGFKRTDSAVTIDGSESGFIASGKHLIAFAIARSETTVTIRPST